MDDKKPDLKIVQFPPLTPPPQSAIDNQSRVVEILYELSTDVPDKILIISDRNGQATFQTNMDRVSMVYLIELLKAKIFKSILGGTNG